MNQKQLAKKIVKAKEILSRCRQGLPWSGDTMTPPAWVRHLLEIGDRGLRKKQLATKRVA